MWPHPTARLRLTLLYSLLFLLTGALLLGLNYLLVQQRLRTMPLVVSNPLPDPQVLAQTDTSADTPLGAIPLNDNQLPAFVQSVHQDLVNTTLNELVVQSSITLAVLSTLAIVFGWIMAGRVLHPIQEITAVARRLSDLNRHERITLQGPRDELKELADTFDMMLDRLFLSFDNQRRFIANASHELRTPLTIMRTEIDVTLSDPNASAADLREMALTVREAVDRSDHLIEGLLLLARSEHSVERGDEIDLTEAIALSLAPMANEVRALNLTIMQAAEPAPVQGNRTLLERLVANIIENAVRHNHRCGWICITTALTPTHASLEVTNSGACVPAEAIEELFAPFRRLADRTRSQRGVGLGLSIVRAIAKSHGGTVTAQPREGGGLIITVTLPRAVTALDNA